MEPLLERCQPEERASKEEGVPSPPSSPLGPLPMNHPAGKGAGQRRGPQPRRPRAAPRRLGRLTDDSLTASHRTWQSTALRDAQKRNASLGKHVCVLREREAEAGFPDPLKAQQTNYNLHKSGILRSPACSEGISFATANELSCLNTNPLHSTSLRGWRCRKHKPFSILVSSQGGPAGRRALCPPLRKGSHRPGSERARNQDAKVTSGRFLARHTQIKSPGPHILSPLPPA